MPLRLIAVGTRMPAWVDSAYQDYARRLRGSHRLHLVEVPTARRTERAGAMQTDRAMQEEARRLLALLGPEETAVVLDERGTEFSSRELATQLASWMRHGAVSFLIGGPDGFAAEVLARAQQRWSLSRLTLPHGLARVVLAEQLYRATSLLAGHPYHRD